MTLATFEKLLESVAPEITKIKTNFRKPFPLRWNWLLVCGFLGLDKSCHGFYLAMELYYQLDVKFMEMYT